MLINGLCNFEDVTKPTTAILWSGLLMCTHSRGTYSRILPIRSVLIHGICNFEDGFGAAKAATASNAELDDKYERLRHVVA